MASHRNLKLGVLVLTTLLLAAGVWSARDNFQKLKQERGQVAAAQARLDAARLLLPKLQAREQFAERSGQLQAQAKAAGFEPEQWAQRRISRNVAPATRREAQEQLAQLGTAQGGRLIAADSFELAVVSRDAGLFTTPAMDDKGLVLGINGTLYFPISSKPGNP